MDYGSSMNDTFFDNFLEWTGFTTNVNTRKYNSAEAQKQRNWEEQMSNTAHQRQVEDMKKAGLNPVLSVDGGAGAATPTGSTGSSNAQSGGSFSNLINSSANLVRSFNNDKDKSNNLNAGSAVKLIGTLAKLLA